MRHRRALLAFVGAVFAVGALLVAGIALEATRLPGAEQLRQTLYARREAQVASIWVPLWAISDRLQAAVVVWEDPAFYHHGAINPPEIARAAWINLRVGRYERGASTITQQLVKNQFLGPEKTLRRKVREVILAHRLEQVLTKQEILTAYLNIAEWGGGTAGAEAASRHYFGKPAARLDWAEAALLAGLLQNPRLRDPCVHPQRALVARQAVLSKLQEYGSISASEWRQAQQAELPACPQGSVGGSSAMR